MTYDNLNNGKYDFIVNTNEKEKSYLFRGAVKIKKAINLGFFTKSLMTLSRQIKLEIGKSILCISKR